MKVRLVDDGLKVWRYSSMWVQYIFGVLVPMWMVMPKEYQDAILTSLGMTPQQMVLFGAFVWVLSSMAARATKIERKPKEPDHVL